MRNTVNGLTVKL